MKKEPLPPLPEFTPPDEVRRRNMAAIRSSGTKPELYVRKVLHAAGFRYRLHRKDLPGKPDLVLPRYHLAVFVHGCFWHRHGCKKDHAPRSNTSYWSAKIDRNVQRDKRNRQVLESTGWEVRVLWECQIVHETALLAEELGQRRAAVAHRDEKGGLR